MGDFELQQTVRIRRRYTAPEDSPTTSEYLDDIKRAIHTQDGAADDGASDHGDIEDTLMVPKTRGVRQGRIAAFASWTEEYVCAGICTLSIVMLSMILWHYDGKENPRFAPGVQLDMIVIALVTISRVAMESIVEACISQYAWIWISHSHQQRTKTHAKLGDFRLFNEAARGLLGSLALIWRLRGMHLACIGGIIVVVTHGFETFSQQMFKLVQQPIPYQNDSIRGAPAAPRSDYWDNIIKRGVNKNYTLPLSTRAAIYSGILASDVHDIEPSCLTGNCSWPIYPSLAVCGECVPLKITKNCAANADAKSCTYSTTESSVDVAVDRDTDAFTLHSMKNRTTSSSSKLAYISTFQYLAASSRPPFLNASAGECAMWVCIKAYHTHVLDGVMQQQLVATLNDSVLEERNNAHLDEYVFPNLPTEMNAALNSRYSVTTRSVETMNKFMSYMMEGTYEKSFEIVNFSSDWTEAVWNAVPEMSSWIEKMTMSLSNEFRQHGQVRDPNNNDYEGKATQMTDFIHVKWPWILYQPFFLFLALYYLVATILASARDDVAIWKNDAMPMLFTRIHSDIEVLGHEKIDKHRGLDHLGKHGVALTKSTDGGWTFVPTDLHVHHKRNFEGLLRATGIRRW